MILAIDPSTTCTGYCILDENKIVEYGSIKPEKISTNESSKLVDIVSALYFICQKYDINKIICENQFGGAGFSSAAKIIALRGAIQYGLHGFAELELVYPVSWRKLLGLSDKGYLKENGYSVKPKSIEWKQISVDYVNKKFNLSLSKKDNDIADAICIGISSI